MIIEVDEKKLKKNYPNFTINYSSVGNFIDATVLATQVDNFEEVGYKIKIEKEVINDEN